MAISNSRLVSMDDDAVVFRTRGQDTATLSPVEFIRSFLQHRLPPGFVKIRHGGLLAPTKVNGPLARAKQMLSQGDQAPPAVPDDDAHRADERATGLPWADLLLILTGVDLKICPACGCRSVVRLPLPTDAATCRGPPEAVSTHAPTDATASRV